MGRRKVSSTHCTSGFSDTRSSKIRHFWANPLGWVTRKGCHKQRTCSLFSHPDGNRPWCHTTIEKMKRLLKTGPKQPGSGKRFCPSQRLRSRAEAGALLGRRGLVREVPDGDEESDEQHEEQQQQSTSGTDGLVRVATEMTALPKSAARVPGRYQRIPDEFIWAEGNPGGLAIIDEDDGNVSPVWDSAYESDDESVYDEDDDDETAALPPPRVATDPDRDADKKDSKMVDMWAREEKGKGVPEQNGAPAGDDMEAEEWPAGGVLADEDIPEQVGLGIYRHSLLHPEDAPSWAVSVVHRSIMEGVQRWEREREMALEQQQDHGAEMAQEETENASNASSAAISIPETTPPDAAAQSSELQALRYEDLSPRPTIPASLVESDATTTRGKWKTRPLSSEEIRRREHRTRYHRDVTLDKLNGRIPAPEFKHADYKEWAATSPVARDMKARGWC